VTWPTALPCTCMVPCTCKAALSPPTATTPIPRVLVP
jgi:hypothetical protein